MVDSFTPGADKARARCYKHRALRVVHVGTCRRIEASHALARTSSFDPSSARGDMESGRFVSCARTECGAMFFLCTHCDRGQRYCTQSCRDATRRAQRRRAGRRDRDSPEARRDAADRQRRFRRPAGLRSTVTGQRSPSPTPSPTVAAVAGALPAIVAAQSGAQEIQDDRDDSHVSGCKGAEPAGSMPACEEPTALAATPSPSAQPTVRTTDTAPVVGTVGCVARPHSPRCTHCGRVLDRLRTESLARSFPHRRRSLAIRRDVRTRYTETPRDPRSL